MKRIIVFCISILCCLSLSCSNFTNINTICKANLEEKNLYPIVDDSVDNIESLLEFEVNPINESTLYQTQYYSTHYFENLRYNMGFNYIGSCSYVAVAMMLSYYDTYWDDGIISEKYDGISDTFNVSLPSIGKSPGILENWNLPFTEENRLGLTGDTKLNYSQYYQLVLNNSDDYFHYKLMKIGREEEIYKLYTYFEINPFGLGLNGRSNLIDTYLYDYMDFLESEISYETVTENVEDYIIEKVTQGIPVLIAVGFPNGLGHALVAYDYDSLTSKIYANMGWGDGYTHIDLDSLNYSLIKNATTFTINTPHIHSNNYIATDGTPYCSCYFSCHPEHEHSYVSVNEDYHTYSCNCSTQGTPNLEHSLYAVKIDGNKHIYKCSGCEYDSEQINHNYHLWRGYSETEHAMRCDDCGYVDLDSVDSHSYEYASFVNDTTHRTECGCGAWGTIQGHVFTLPDINGRMVCRGCGYVKFFGSGSGNVIYSSEKVSINGSCQMPDGTIYLVPEDVEAYLNGTLVFYDKDDLPVLQ